MTLLEVDVECSVAVTAPLTAAPCPDRSRLECTDGPLTGRRLVTIGIRAPILRLEQLPPEFVATS